MLSDGGGPATPSCLLISVSTIRTVKLEHLSLTCTRIHDCSLRRFTIVHSSSVLCTVAFPPVCITLKMHIYLCSLVFACHLPCNCTLCGSNTMKFACCGTIGQYLIFCLHVILAIMGFCVVHIKAVSVGVASASPPVHFWYLFATQ